jgi:hypothetical protein
MHANACSKTLLVVHSIHLSNKQIYRIFDMLNNLCFIFHKMALTS